MGGVRFRGLDVADLTALHDLVRSVERADQHPLASQIEELAAVFDEPDFDPRVDAFLGVLDDRVVAYGRQVRSTGAADFERVSLEGMVHPEHRRRGIGSALLALQIDRARDVLAETTEDLPRYIRVAAFDWCRSARALYESAGMVPVRWFEDLGRDLERIPDVDIDPAISIVGFERSEEVRLVHNETFGDHWGSVPASAQYWTHRLEQPGTRLDLSFVAIAADEIVGYVLSGHYPHDRAVTGRESGWINTLGTRRAWRGRGVGSGLVVAALRAYAAAGFDHAMIGVDADNPTGAARLYRALGFERLHGGVTYELAL